MCLKTIIMWKYLIYYIFNLCCDYGNADEKLLLPDYGRNKHMQYNSITECIITISDMVLYFRPTVAILEQKGTGSEDNEFNTALIDKLVQYNIPQVRFEDIIDEEYHDLHNTSLTVAFFYSCDDVLDFNFTDIDRAIKFLIIISSTPSLDCRIKLKEVGEFVSNYDVTFIIKDHVVDQYKFYTIFPKIDEKTCMLSVEEPMHINTCSNGTLQKTEIFPIKNPTNLNKCPFKVGMATLYPFSEIKDKDSLKNYDRVEEAKGSDLEIMKIITKYFNATLDLYYIFRAEENPYSDKDFLTFLMNGSLDACAGGLYRIYGDIVEYSGIYVSQNVFWVYYAERAEISWQNLIHKMKDVYIFVIFYISYSFVWYLISMFDGDAVSLGSTLFHAWGALVGATSLQDARTLKQKVLNLMYLIMCIYLSAFISIHFYSFLTIRDPPHLLKSNDDVMTSGRTAYLKESTKYFITDEKYVEFANKSQGCVSFYDCAVKTLERNGITIILHGNFYSFQAGTAVNDEARILRSAENMLTVFNEMMIRKDSPLVAKFQSVVHRLFEGGITKRLFHKAIGISIVAKANSANTNMISSSYSCQAGCSITLKQFAGVFYVWTFGTILSCIVFFLEIWIKRERKTNTEDAE